MLVGYPSYRASGTPWAQQIPEHWQTARLRYVAHIGNGTTPSRDRTDYWQNGTIPWLNSGQVNDYVVQQARQFITSVAQKETSLRLWPKGSVIVGLYGQGKTRGTPAYLNMAATINQALAGIMPGDEMDGRFLHYMFIAGREFLRNEGRGGSQPNLNCSIVGSFAVLLPPLAEQEKIAHYLRTQDTKIARFIRIKRELIARLNEQKLRLIDHAVTGGLDTTAQRKPSGVAWLGDVPAHWEVLKLKFATKKIVGGSTPKSDNPSYWDGGLVWITPRDISKSNALYSSQRTISVAGLQSCGTVLVPPESIIITSRAPVGNVAVARVELCTNQGCKAIVPAPEIVSSEYLFLLLFRMKERLQALSNGTTFMEIGTWTLENESVAVPSLEEQHAILTHIKARTEPLTAAIHQAEKEITLIREYRERLIHDAVTGQMDLRGWQGAENDTLDDDSLADLTDDEVQEAEEDIPHDNA